jgi:hypothetical protein
MFWKKTTPNNGSGSCPNVTFEDDDFKEDGSGFCPNVTFEDDEFKENSIE